jgi:hypothetical protein
MPPRAGVVSRAGSGLAGTLAVALASAAAFSCSRTGPVAPDAGEPPITVAQLHQFAADYAAAWFDWNQRCFPLAGYLRAARQSQMADQTEAALVEGVDAGLLTVVAAKLPACLQAQRLRSCASQDRPTAACSEAIHGPLEPGTPCDGAFACAPGSSCPRDGGFCSLRGDAGPGGECSSDGDCLPDLRCLATDRFQSRNKRCSSGQDAGQPCLSAKANFHAACADGLYCPPDYFRSGGPPNYSDCQPVTGAGLACGRLASCGRALACIGLATGIDPIWGLTSDPLVVRAGTCAPAADEGGNCVTPPDGGFTTVYYYPGGYSTTTVVADQLEPGCLVGLVCADGGCRRP